MAVIAGASTVKVGDRVAWINRPGSYADRIAPFSELAIVIPPGFSTANALLLQSVRGRAAVIQGIDEG